jgi:hypothetical protein
MADKLGVFNEALRILGQAILTSPEAQNEAGRQLRDTLDATVKACLEAENWNHAVERAELARLAETPAFGYSYYYALPADKARTVYISQTGRPREPLLACAEESGKIATDAPRVYLVYISKERLATYSIGKWTQAFADFVSASLALRIAPKINPGALELADAAVKSKRAIAQSLDAVQNPPARRQPGSWASAHRRGMRSQENG